MPQASFRYELRYGSSPKWISEGSLRFPTAGSAAAHAKRILDSFPAVKNFRVVFSDDAVNCDETGRTL